MISIRTSVFTLLIAAFPMLQLWAQGPEPESVDRYRKKVEFKMPDANQAEDSAYPSIKPETTTVTSSGVVGVHCQAEPGIDKLVDIHRRTNAASVETEGFRIQIYAGGDQNLANGTRADFISSFYSLDMPIYQTWQPPHFRVRVGDFRSRPEALQELANIRKVFPDAFVVSDKVKVRKTRKAAPAPEPSLTPEGDKGMPRSE